jgi:hypothetical protein
VAPWSFANPSSCKLAKIMGRQSFRPIGARPVSEPCTFDAAAWLIWERNGLLRAELDCLRDQLSPRLKGIATQYAWLIEHKGNQTEWLRVTSSTPDDVHFVWITDANAAIRFSRKVDAELFLELLFDGHDHTTSAAAICSIAMMMWRVL